MSKAIWKYQFDARDHMATSMPRGAIIRHVDNQDDCITIWAEVDTDAIADPQFETRLFRVFGTGHDIDDGGLNYVGTVMIDPFVWHVYEVE